MGTTRSVRGTWYWLAVIPAAIGGAIAIGGVSNLVDRIEQMPRIVVPGTGEVALEPGDYVAYGETQSVLGGIAYRTQSLQLRCGMRALPNHATDDGGESIALRAPSAHVRYGLGGYSGESMFALTIAHAGRYRVHCEGSGGPATLSIGSGLGAGIVTLVLGIVGGAFAAIATLFVVRVLRRRAARAALGRAPASDAAPA
jgi:hypothetical protein